MLSVRGKHELFIIIFYLFQILQLFNIFYLPCYNNLRRKKKELRNHVEVKCMRMRNWEMHNVSYIRATMESSPCDADT